MPVVAAARVAPGKDLRARARARAAPLRSEELWRALFTSGRDDVELEALSAGFLLGCFRVFSGFGDRGPICQGGSSWRS